MRVQHRSTSGDRVIGIDLGPPSDDRVSDLVAALGEAEPGTGLIVDGAWFAASAPLTTIPLREGSLIEPAPVPQSAPPPSARMLAVIGGLRAGVLHPVVPGASLSIGRGDGNDIVIDDPSVSRRHLSVRLDDNPVVVDLGSRNGTAVAGRRISGPTTVAADVTVRLGATRLAWRGDPADVPFAFRVGLGAVGGTVPFNRPPRAAPMVDPVTVSVPPEPPDPPPPEPLSWAGIVLPVVGGAIVALLLSPLFAVFAALGPILTIGTWYERRRRARRSRRADLRCLARAVSELGGALPSSRAAETSRLMQLHPDPGEVVRRASGPSVRCWERRRSDPDFMQLAVGTFDQPWAPPLVVDGRGDAARPPATRAVDLLRVQPPLIDVPFTIDLSPGRMLGLVGPAAVTASIARSLVLQAAVHHGPADLAVCVLASSGGTPAEAWGWATWLPHSTDVAGGRPGGFIATAPSEVAPVLEAASLDPSDRTRLVVVVGEEALTGRTAPGRTLLDGDNVTAIVLVPDEQFLPAACTTVGEVVHPAGRIRLLDPRTTDAVDGVVAWGLDPETSGTAARGLARLDDPDLAVAAAEIPSSVSLLDLLGGDVDLATVTRRWAESQGTADLRAPIGADGRGTTWLDMVADGPHVLIGGTTGSGKSELLRSLVVGLAAGADPDHLAFVLVDYKGGAAFDSCTELPHVAGMVTDLDDRLAERALRCLEAELRHREERLRSENAEDLAAFRLATTGRDVEPLPRLVVVIDEFASMAAELPDFLRSLVAIAQRGRSLGVHLVLATQRPAGVVTEDIRANTGCRIALRVTDRQDSIDVIDVADAGTIPRHRPGRAVARLGPGELVGFQSALVTGHTSGRGGVRVAPVAAAPCGSTPSEAGAPTDLDRLVGAIREAHDATGASRPRSPWPAPLPPRVDAERLHARAGDSPAVWLVDDPDGQTQMVEGWDPSDGHLVVLGGPGSGRSTTLAAVALDLCRRHSADDLQLFAVDLDSGTLDPLIDLPHAGAVTAASEAERRTRLIRMLAEEVAERRAGRGSDRPQIVLLIDELGGLARAHDPVRHPDIHDQLTRIFTEGPGVGVRIAATVGRAGELGSEVSATVGAALIHRVTDPGDGLRLGGRVDTSGFSPGRAVRVSDGREIHVGHPGDVAAAVRRAAADAARPAVPPPEVGSLDPVIDLDQLPGAVQIGPGQIEVIFARDHHCLAPCGLTLHPGEHALVLGPPRSGRTNTLAVIGRLLGPAAVVVGPEGNELAERLGVAPIDPCELRGIIGDRHDGPRVVLVDDADRVADPVGLLAAAVTGSTGVSLIVATSADRLRAGFGHWTSELRSCRSGMIIRPGPIDGDLLGVTLPPRLDLPILPGRGLLVSDGVACVVQVASEPTRRSLDGSRQCSS